MQLVTHAVHDEHAIYFLGDIHYGLVACHTRAFLEVIDEIKHKDNAVVIFMGDLVEGRTLEHPYYDLEAADTKMMLPENQYEAFKEAIMPIKHKIITIHEGNHDRGLSRVYGSKVRTICEKDVKVPYGTFSAVTTLRSKKKSNNIFYKIYTTHGSGSIRSSAGDIIRQTAFKKESLKRKLKNKASDCLAMLHAHTHGLLVAEPMKRLWMISNEKKIQQVYSNRPSRSVIIPEDDRWYGLTGSFQKRDVLGMTTYAEAAGYDPTEMGYVVIHGKDGDIVNMEAIPV